MFDYHDQHNVRFFRLRAKRTKWYGQNDLLLFSCYGKFKKNYFI